MGQVSLKGVHKQYGNQSVINGIDLEVDDGEFMVFVGPSGCGKSTTLRMIAGLETMSQGQLWIDGVESNAIQPAARGVAMVFQSYALYPHMTVEQNMGFALKMAGVSKDQRNLKVSQTAEVLRISHLLNSYPRQLSGGERQRVAIGRAIVRDPKVFLFDEPLSNLDAALRVEMRIELTRLHKELGTTMIYVTHDQVEAMTMGNRIAVFNRGKIEQVGAPMDLYRHPRNEFVAQFLGTPKVNLFNAPNEQSNAGYRRWWHSVGDSNLQDVKKIGIRPESFLLVDNPDSLIAEVVLIEQLGDTSVLHCQIQGLKELMTVKLNGDAEVRQGQTIKLATPTQHVMHFNSQSQLATNKV